MDEIGFIHYDDELRKFINITASLTHWDGSQSKNLTTIHTNYKKIRLCNKADFENVGYIQKFEEDEENNFDYCIDNYDGMVLTNNQN